MGAAGVPRAPVQRRSRSRAGRVVILGFDGLDYGLVTRWLAAGRLPNLARLAAGGTYAPLATTTPAESPVAWAAFSICANPGQTGIFDFLTKVPGTYDPTLALVHEGRMPFYPSPWLRAGAPLGAAAALAGGAFGAAKAFRSSTRRALMAALPVGALVAAGGLTAAFRLIPRELPTAVRDRLGTGFWSVAGSAGVPAAVLQAPVCFPAEHVPNGRLISGLGVPDLRGTAGSSTLYDTLAEGESEAAMSGRRIGITVRDGRVETTIPGPPDFLSPDRRPIRRPFTFTVDRAARRVTISVDGRSQTLREGEWSDLFDLRFRVHPLASAVGLGRFCLMECGDRVQLYLSPISIHPGHVPPIVALSQPRSYAAELAEQIGPFKTVGFAAEVYGLNQGFIDEDAFMADLWDVVAQREAMLETELARDDWQLLFALFQATDRVQHMLWRLFDPTHPFHDTALAERHGGAIREVYERADAIVGRVMARLKPDDVLIVLSDHGFAGFARSVNLNTYLVKAGLMVLKDDRPRVVLRAGELFEGADFWPNVDWGRTRAFALGLSQVYLNCKGREPEGIVRPGRAFDETLAEVKATLERCTDPATGRRVIHSVTAPRDVYRGQGMHRAPDLIVSVNRGYRVSWQTTLGGIPEEVIEPNLERWSGDHCSVAAALVPGVLFANRSLRTADAGIADVGATALDLLGVPLTDQMDGRSLAP